MEKKSKSVAGELLTCSQAAKLAKIPARTLRNLAHDKQIPAQLVGSVWLFRRADVLAWEKRAPGRPPKGASK